MKQNRLRFTLGGFKNLSKKIYSNCFAEEEEIENIKLQSEVSM